MTQPFVNHKAEFLKEYVNNTNMHIFLTGKAGTGKTTLLREIVLNSPKRKVVVAPTGIAAINAGGVTIHSFFQLPYGVNFADAESAHAINSKLTFKYNKSKLNIIRSLELLIIDEVSMLRADLLDEIDLLLKKVRNSSAPFGGIQLLMIGDMQQLPPVVSREEAQYLNSIYDSPYFFSSNVLKNNEYICIELDHIYRQRDKEFIDILEAVRRNQISYEVLDKLNARYNADFKPDDNDGYVTLCTHNNTATRINTSKLNDLDCKEYKFYSRVEGRFPESMYPLDEVLTLKKGAQVMFTKNDSDYEKRFVNGTLATVIDIADNYIEVETTDGDNFEVGIATWENTKYNLDNDTKEIVREVEGEFFQYPLKLAWAITIHKSQGLTFDKLVIDAGASFAHGQVYVALSRCRTLEGIVLNTRITNRSVINDSQVTEFSSNIATPNQEALDNAKRNFYYIQLTDIFNINELRRDYYNFLRFVNMAVVKQYPKVAKLWNESKDILPDAFFSVSENFVISLSRLVQSDYKTSEFLIERLLKASTYFKDKTTEIIEPICNAAMHLDFDSKEEKKVYKQQFERFYNLVAYKLALYNYLLEQGEKFDMDAFLKFKAVSYLEIIDNKLPKASKVKPSADGEPVKTVVSEDILNPELYEKLRSWREAKSKELGVAAFVVAHNKALIGIANNIPVNGTELLAVKGVGKAFVQKYGAEVLGVVGAFDGSFGLD